MGSELLPFSCVKKISLSCSLFFFFFFRTYEAHFLNFLFVYLYKNQEHVSLGLELHWLFSLCILVFTLRLLHASSTSMCCVQTHLCSNITLG